MILLYKKIKTTVCFFEVFYLINFVVNYRRVCFFMFLKFSGFLGVQNFLMYFYKFQNYFLVRNTCLNFINTSFKMLVLGVVSGWFLHFVLTGYNYRLKSSFFNSFLLVYLGFFYSCLFKLPNSIKVFRRKRAFIIFSNNLLDFNFTVRYLRHLRDLFPYKIRGLTLKKEVVRLKKGKKVKFR